VIVGSLWLFLQRTNVGLIVRAGIRDHTMIRALGVRFDRYRTLVFAVGVAVAGLAGVLTGPISGVYPEMGADILVLTFVVVVVGGMGSFWGAVLAGLLIGVLVSLTTLYASVYAGIVPFLLMILVMSLRPRGLLGAGVSASSRRRSGPLPSARRRHGSGGGASSCCSSGWPRSSRSPCPTPASRSES
jgi:branched-chain amino acid transport system permease protein